ncbi:MIK2, partial [Symbiodinium sp. CCMP2456]
YAALSDFFSAAGGVAGTWKNASGWLQGPPCQPGKMESSWHGVACKDCQVVAIFVGLNRLTGHISNSLNNLTRLWDLDLYQNELTGPLPQQPPQGSGGEGVHVNLGENRLSGPLPAAWAQSPELVTLRIYNNSFSGPIPSDWRQSKRLEYLDLRSNSFVGGLPILLPPSIRNLYLQDNSFHGRLPDQWAPLPLRNILLGNNRITGPLRSSWGEMPSLEAFAAQGNQLVGDVTDVLEKYRNLTQLRVLLLHNNQLSGCIKRLPPSLYESSRPLRPDAQVLLFGNHFSCKLPTPPHNATNITAFVLPGNRFSLPSDPFGWYTLEAKSPLAEHGWTKTMIFVATLLVLLAVVQTALWAWHWYARRLGFQARSVRHVFGSVPFYVHTFFLLDAIAMILCMLLWPQLNLYTCPPVLESWSAANLNPLSSSVVPYAILSSLLGFSSGRALRYGLRLRQMCQFERGTALDRRSVQTILILMLISVLLHSVFALVKSIPEENTLGITRSISDTAGWLIPVMSVANREVTTRVMARRLPDHGVLQSSLLLASTLSWVAPLMVSGLLNDQCIGAWRWFWELCDIRNAAKLEFKANGVLVANRDDFCTVPAESHGFFCMQSMAELALQLLLPKMVYDACFQIAQLLYPNWKNHASRCLARVCRRCHEAGMCTGSMPAKPANWEVRKAALKIQSALQQAILFGPFIPVIYLACFLNTGAHLLRMKGFPMETSENARSLDLALEEMSSSQATEASQESPEATFHEFMGSQFSFLVLLRFVVAFFFCSAMKGPWGALSFVAGCALNLVSFCPPCRRQRCQADRPVQPST